MKRLLIALMLMAMPVSAGIKALEIPVNAICWDSREEAVEYHAKILGEFPILKLYSEDENGGALLVKPDNTKWTFLAFKTHPVTRETIACAFFTGEAWSIIQPPLPEKDIET